MSGLPLLKRISILVKSLADTSFIKRFREQFRDFPFFWGMLCLFLFIIAVMAMFTGSWSWSVSRIVVYIFIVAVTILFLTRPMNVVYGLMGTTGSIVLFFANFLVITFVFALVYQVGFFHHAAVSYDINQPHIDYDYYLDGDRVAKKEPSVSTYTLTKFVDDTMIKETVVQVDSLTYQPIPFGQTWRNTIMTTLMQEPTDFFSAAATYNAGMEQEDGKISDQSKAAAFHWLLIVQVLISWIFFGVFISLLYNKFRYES